MKSPSGLFLFVLVLYVRTCLFIDKGMDLRVCVPANASLRERSIGHTGEELFQSIPERLLAL